MTATLDGHHMLQNTHTNTQTGASRHEHKLKPRWQCDHCYQAENGQCVCACVCKHLLICVSQRGKGQDVTVETFRLIMSAMESTALREGENHFYRTSHNITHIDYSLLSCRGAEDI